MALCKPACGCVPRLLLLALGTTAAVWGFGVGGLDRRPIVAKTRCCYNCNSLILEVGLSRSSVTIFLVVGRLHGFEALIHGRTDIAATLQRKLWLSIWICEARNQGCLACLFHKEADVDGHVVAVGLLSASPRRTCRHSRPVLPGILGPGRHIICPGQPP